MRTILMCIALAFLTMSISLGQKSSFSVKAGLTTITTKTIREPANDQVELGPKGNRIGVQAGVVYSYKLMKYVSLSADLQYLLKGYSYEIPYPPPGYEVSPPIAEHYLGLASGLGFFPFANSQSKYISCISPGIGINLNYLVRSEFDWRSAVDRNYWETGYTLSLAYKPGKFGFQIYHSVPFTKYLTYHNNTPAFDESRYYFVTGISFIYNLF